MPINKQLYSGVFNFKNEKSLDENITNLMEQAHIPSLSACIIKNNSVVWKNGYGYSNIFKKINATENTIYLAASISKTITATALMQLWEKGLFNLDDDVNKFLPFSLRNPSFPDSNITFRMLLAHHSSLAKGGNNVLVLLSSFFNFPKSIYKEFLTPSGKFYSTNYWLDVQPGKKLAYSNIGYLICGYLVEIISGQTLEKYCKDNVFEPLDMVNTNFQIFNYNKRDLATPYIWLSNLYIPLPHYENKNYAGGGLRTSVMDLSHFLIAYMNNGTYNGEQILNDETIELIKTIQFNTDNSSRYVYGLGWRVYRNNNTFNIGHSGAMPGTLTYMFYRPDNNVGIIVFTNQYSFFSQNDIMTWLSIIWLFYGLADQL